MAADIIDALHGEIYGIWFLAGAALVFWMQAGFAMVETGFARAKNAGNILMKNLMDFCIGTVMFIILGYGLMFGENALGGFLGIPTMQIFSAYSEFDWSTFVFNLVFCATTATIVSGAMAERTRFISYCVYSGIISAVIYPIEAHWTWGGGWLARIGFHDFAGSNCIHMVGGICALIGAAMLGPRIGKFTKDKDGKITKVNAFPGHNIPLGALGVFILWLGWYGFNGAAATSLPQLGTIFLVTTVAPAVATVVCMIFTWVRYGKPDVSMCLNASLAGLVAITAPCDTVDCFGSIVIGAVAGVLVVFGVWFLDNILRVDDPVGAVAVHCMNGIWGTIAVGLFSTDTVPGYSLANAEGEKLLGLFYGGGFELLGIQLLGMLSTAVFTAVTITIAFLIIKAIFGLRASAEEEITGLDVTEHGLTSAYTGFSIMDITGTELQANENTDLGVPDYDAAPQALKDASVPVTQVKVTETGDAAAAGAAGAAADAGTAAAVAAGAAAEGSSVVPAAVPTAVHSLDTGMHKVVIITRLSKYDRLTKALNELGVTGMTATQVMGCGLQKGAGERYRGVEIDATLIPKVKIEVVVSKIPVESVIETAKKTLYTGHIGDGKIFVYTVDRVVKVRTGEEDFAALQDVE